MSLFRVWLSRYQTDNVICFSLQLSTIRGNISLSRRCARNLLSMHGRRKQWIHMRRFLSIVTEICPRDFPLFFPSTRVSGNNCSTVVTAARWCKFNTLFEPAAKKNLHKIRSKRKRIRERARMIESSVHFRYWSRQRQKFHGISSIIDTLVIVAPCSAVPCIPADFLDGR